MGKRVREEIDTDHLLTVAARFFAEHGFDGIGIREIAAEAGIPATSIYRHFDSKLGLFQEASAKRYEQTFAIVSAAVEGGKTPEQKLNALVDTFFDIFIEDQVLFMLLQRDVTESVLRKTRSVMKGHYDQYIQLIEGILHGFGGDKASQTDVMTLAALIFGYCELIFITRQGELQIEDAWYREQKDHLRHQVALICRRMTGLS